MSWLINKKGLRPVTVFMVGAWMGGHALRCSTTQPELFTVSVPRVVSVPCVVAVPCVVSVPSVVSVPCVVLYRFTILYFIQMLIYYLLIMQYLQRVRECVCGPVQIPILQSHVCIYIYVFFCVCIYTRL